MPCAVNDGEAQPNPALCSSTQIKASQHALAGENSLCVPDLPFHLLIAPLPRENTLSQSVSSTWAWGPGLASHDDGFLPGGFAYA